MTPATGPPLANAATPSLSRARETHCSPEVRLIDVRLPDGRLYKTLSLHQAEVLAKSGAGEARLHGAGSPLEGHLKSITLNRTPAEAARLFDWRVRSDSDGVVVMQARRVGTPREFDKEFRD